MLYVTRLTQNQNDSINAILQYGRVVGKGFGVGFSSSGFLYLILCSRQCKGKIAIPVQKSAAVKASISYKKWHSILNH